MSAVPPDGRILFARRDREHFGFLNDAFEAPFVFEGRRWPSRAAWAHERLGRPYDRRDALRAQFAQHPELRRALLDTGTATLVDDSAGERGAGPPEAAFLSGALLMALRAELVAHEHAADVGTPNWLDELLASLAWLGP
ncbi:MAG: NADAR family protein [Candidatus Eisenbacteria bacterium]